MWTFCHDESFTSVTVVVPERDFRHKLHPWPNGFGIHRPDCAHDIVIMITDRYSQSGYGCIAIPAE